MHCTQADVVNNMQNLSGVKLTNITDNPNALKSGDSVFVRVLAKEGSGQFIVSFAGKKMSVFSERNLDIGSAFKALVTIANGKVFLTPQTDSQNAKNVFNLNSDTLMQLKNFLQDLGLPNDMLSLKIIQYFQSSGMSFNAKLASKARSIGLKFPGRENEATEIALFLEQKGIDANIETVMQLLGVLYGGQQQFHHNQNDDSAEPANNSANNKTVLDQLYENPQDILTKEVGLLAVLNHTYVNSQHWIILPFEMMGNESELNGSVRLLLDLEQKTVKKMVIFANLTSQNQSIVLYCKKCCVENKDGYDIQFCFNKKDSSQNEKQLVAMLKNLLPKNIHFEVSYNAELLESIFTIDSTISFVQVDA